MNRRFARLSAIEESEEADVKVEDLHYTLEGCGDSLCWCARNPYDDVDPLELLASLAEPATDMGKLHRYDIFDFGD